MPTTTSRRSGDPYIATVLVLVTTVVRFDDTRLGAPSALLEPHSRETD